MIDAFFGKLRWFRGDIVCVSGCYIEELSVVMRRLASDVSSCIDVLFMVLNAENICPSYLFRGGRGGCLVYFIQFRLILNFEK